MSNRTLIEINHDFCGDLGPTFLSDLERYLRSATRESADRLRVHGVSVVGMRHHSGRYYLDGEPDGFPAVCVPRTDPPQ